MDLHRNKRDIVTLNIVFLFDKRTYTEAQAFEMCGLSDWYRLYKLRYRIRNTVTEHVQSAVFFFDIEVFFNRLNSDLRYITETHWVVYKNVPKILIVSSGFVPIQVARDLGLTVATVKGMGLYDVINLYEKQLQK